MRISRAARMTAMALSLLAAFIFVAVAVTEINYVSDHPFAYGPAKVIAWAAAAGAILSAAAALLAIAIQPPTESLPR